MAAALDGLNASLQSVAAELDRLWREAGPGSGAGYALRLIEASHRVHGALAALADDEETSP